MLAVCRGVTTFDSVTRALCAWVVEASLAVETYHAAIGIFLTVYFSLVAFGIKRRLLRAGGVSANNFAHVHHVDVGMLLAIGFRLAGIATEISMFLAGIM